MKKVFSIVMGLALVASLASCKKDHTCACKDADGDSENFKYTKTSKKDAKKACDVQSTAFSLVGGSCELK